MGHRVKVAGSAAFAVLDARRFCVLIWRLTGWTDTRGVLMLGMGRWRCGCLAGMHVARYCSCCQFLVGVVLCFVNISADRFSCCGWVALSCLFRLHPPVVPTVTASRFEMVGVAFICLWNGWLNSIRVVLPLVLLNDVEV